MVEAYKAEVARLQGISASESVIILTTAPSVDVAHQLAHALVEQHLAACVNVVGPMTSIYRWKDSVQQDSEFQLIVKTARGRIEGVREAVRRQHPYELPEFLVLDVSEGDGAYLEWLLEATRQSG